VREREREGEIEMRVHSCLHGSRMIQMLRLLKTANWARGLRGSFREQGLARIVVHGISGLCLMKLAKIPPSENANRETRRRMQISWLVKRSDILVMLSWIIS